MLSERSDHESDLDQSIYQLKWRAFANIKHNVSISKQGKLNWRGYAENPETVFHRAEQSGKDYLHVASEFGVAKTAKSMIFTRKI
jgi:hypothetical protein